MLVRVVRVANDILNSIGRGLDRSDRSESVSVILADATDIACRGLRKVCVTAQMLTNSTLARSVPVVGQTAVTTSLLLCLTSASAKPLSFALFEYRSRGLTDLVSRPNDSRTLEGCRLDICTCPFMVTCSVSGCMLCC